jgi:4-hydroxybenzoate polyprenyltransferase
VFYLQLIVTLTVMAGGYWVNDVFDFKIDRINKPKKTIVGNRLSAKKTLTAYWAINIFAAMLSFFLPYKFWLVNWGASIGLFFYAAYLKKYAVWGNLLVAVMTALPIVAGAMLYHFKPPHLWAAIFAFWVNFTREVVKDVEDVRGDLMHGLRTLPILLGFHTTKKFLLACYVVLTLHLPMPAVFYYFWSGETIYLYMILILFSVFPLLILCLKELINAVNPSEYSKQSKLLKLMMMTGLISLFALPL